MANDESMAVDDVGELGDAYIPYLVVYRNINDDTTHNLLIFAVDVRIVATLAEELLSSLNIDYLVTNIGLVNVQYTIVQKAPDSCPSGTDELDDPIRRS